MKTPFIITIFTVILTFWLKSATAQYNREAYDTKHNDTILVGQIDAMAFMLDRYSNWYEMEYQPYSPDEAKVDSINLIKPKYEIVIILATWCSDSRTQVPRFFNIYDKLSQQAELKMWALNENKRIPEYDISLYKIERVPTFIFYRNGLEIGRITEQPTTSLESDWLKIISQK